MSVIFLSQLMQVPNFGLSQQQQPPTQAHEIPINAQGNNIGLGRAACKSNSCIKLFAIKEPKYFLTI